MCICNNTETSIRETPVKPCMASNPKCPFLLLKKNIWLWQITQFVLILLFTFLLYRIELRVTNTILTSEQSFGFVPLFHSYLLQQPTYGVPGQNWLLMWPFFIVSLSLLLLKQWRWYFLGLVGILSALLLFADVVYFSFFSTPLTVSSLRAAPQLWEVRDSVMAALHGKELLLFCGPFFLFFAWGVLVHRYAGPNYYRNKVVFALDKGLAIVFFLLALNCYKIAFFFELHYVEMFSDERGVYSIVIHESGNRIQDSGQQPFVLPFDSSPSSWAVFFGVINFHLKDIITELSFSNDPVLLTSSERQQLKSWLHQKQKQNQIGSPLQGMAAGRNVVVISLESFHPLLLNLQIGGIPVTPTLNLLIKSGISWNHILDMAYSGGSSDSEFALMTGLRPSKQKISSLELPQTIRLNKLPQILKKEGYSTVSMHGLNPDIWNYKRNHELFGVDKSFFINSFHTAKFLGMGIPDQDFFIQAADYLDKQTRPFFAYLISLSSHHPYKDIPEGYQYLFDNEILSRYPEVQHYLQLCRYTDDALKVFFKMMQAQDLTDNTLFVLYGDHTPPMAKESMNYFKTQLNVSLNDIKDRVVPLILLIPGYKERLTAAQAVYGNTVGSHYDIPPTILHFLGIDIPIGMTGTHLFVPESRRDPIPISSEVFADQGILYGPGNKFTWPNFPDVHDQVTRGDLRPGNNIQQKYKLAQRDTILHQLLFDSDGLRVLHLVE
ncbi:MAG: hypothetical protein D3906_02850 [Candidatus Electrothrix sp. AUS1_2]|nr:hypothetical protein [Candidatus Electrothrix sp. AUS1_2]